MIIFIQYFRTLALLGEKHTQLHSRFPPFFTCSSKYRGSRGGGTLHLTRRSSAVKICLFSFSGLVEWDWIPQLHGLPKWLVFSVLFFVFFYSAGIPASAVPNTSSLKALNIQLQPTYNCSHTSKHKLPELLNMCCYEPARFSTSCQCSRFLAADWSNKLETALNTVSWS